MSLNKLHLRKLMLLLDASSKKRRRLLLDDIASGRRADARRKAGLKNEGGDFYGPFWADAKDHVFGRDALREASVSRVQTNSRRKRLYPTLTETFLKWWDEKRRWRNEPFEDMPHEVKAQFPISELNSTIKVEGLLAVRVVGQYDRIVYPYFCETPVLSPGTIRVGLWVLGKALPEFALEDVRVLDVFRSASYGIRDQPLQGDEHRRLISNYSAILEEWNKLKDEK